MMFALEEKQKTVAKLKVLGVGGAGGNAVNRMVQSGMQGVEFVVINTDAMALEHNQAEIKMQIGTTLTRGLGAGANPQMGMLSMQEDREKVRAQLEGADMVFIAAGMGGGTGTGAAPVVAELARELDILTVAVVTKPFAWEGPVRERNAQAGLDALRRVADTVIVVPNQKLLSVVEKTTTMRAAFAMADEILISAVRGISEIIHTHGDVQVDFADVRTIMNQGGDALMGMGRASGENKATVAADRAIHSPLLDNVNIAGATGVLVNITGGEDMAIDDVSLAMNVIYVAVGQGVQANIIMGTVVNPDMKDEIAITVIATGFGNTTRNSGSSMPARDTLRRPMPSPMPTPRMVTTENETLSSNDDSVESSPYEPRVRAEDIPTSKVPFGARPARPMAPVRSDEPVAETAAVRRGTFSNPFASRRQESEPDIDYETPAFLRNQAD